MGLLSKEQLRELIKEKHLVTADDVQNMLKEMFAETLQEMLEAELDTELGYPKNGSSPEGGSNRRNGHTKKNVRSQYGDLELNIPRDREGDFEPAVVKKHQKEVTGIEEQILGLYARNELKNRGVEDILICSVDNLTGFSEAITACFPNTEIQKCIVHQIRNSIRYVSYKDTKKLLANLKPVYSAPSEDAALAALDDFEKYGVQNIRLSCSPGIVTGAKSPRFSSIRRRSEN